jgi:dephospho-CoA kinase
MLRIGLTGGIAAGKSVVTSRLRTYGAVIVDADALARAAVGEGSEGLAEVVDAFGPGILAPDGGLDRPALGRLVFSDRSARERLNAIVHPRVRAGAARLIERAPAGSVVVEDIPLLVETGQAARFHLVVVVDAPDDLRIERMVGQRGMDRDDAVQRIAAQATRAERLREADAVLVNDRSLEELLTATEALWHGRIVPFRDNLTAGRPAVAGHPTAAAGTNGTGDLERRVRAKLRAALPESASVERDPTPLRVPEERPGGHTEGAVDRPVDTASESDDVTHAALRVTVTAKDVEAASDAVSATGFPPVGSEGGHPTGIPGLHRAADPAIDVTVTVGGTAASA